MQATQNSQASISQPPISAYSYYLIIYYLSV